MAQLQQMLENMRNAQMANRNNPNSAAMMRMMRNLQNLTNRQRELLDQTFRGAQEGKRGQKSERQTDGSQTSGSRLGTQQEGLRRQLGEFMRRLGESNGRIPGGFGRAEQAMRDAIEELNRGALGSAVTPQSQALDELQQAGRSLAREFARRLGMGSRSLQQQLDRQSGMDPLGRPRGGMGADTRDVAIPDESDLQRARRIRDELHERSGDRFRPQYERDYIERLLERF
jgi:hypothetical protein